MRCFPHVSFTGPGQDYVLPLIARPIVPTVQRRTVLAAVKAWPPTIEVAAHLQHRPALTAGCARCAGWNEVGTEKRPRSNKETGSGKRSSLQCLSLNSASRILLLEESAAPPAS